MKIVVDDKIPFIAGAFERAGCETVYLPGAAIDASAVRDADALVVRTRTRCDEKLLGSSRVRCVATATIGFDHLDTIYLTERGIAWSNAPGCNAPSVRNYLASVLTRLEADGKIRLAGATLGVVGVGQVGGRVGQLAETLGMRVLYNDPPRAEREGAAGFVSLDEIRRDSDLVTFHVPRVTSGEFPTENLADEAFFAGLKPGAWFINTSRGETVDETALKAALKSGRLGGAVLDVWRNEPEIDRELMDLLAGATPHIAGYSADGKANGTTQAVRFVGCTLGIAALADWRASGIPEPADAEIVLPEENPVAEAVRRSYDFRVDDAALRADPAAFEQLRGNYRVRREFPAYRIMNPGTRSAFWQAMGFQVNAV